MLATAPVDPDEVIVGTRVECLDERRGLELLAVLGARDVASLGLVGEGNQLPDNQQHRAQGGQGGRAAHPEHRATTAGGLHYAVMARNAASTCAARAATSRWTAM